MKTIKPNELRIGNLIHYQSECFDTPELLTVDGEFIGRYEGYCTVAQSDYKPILLTEEWLERFGFEKYGYGFIDKNETIWISFEKESPLCYLCMNREFFPLLTAVEYIHQLQNMYFALTGEELEINQ